MVTARSASSLFRERRHRPARYSSAVESGPPETASTSARACATVRNRTLASAAEIGRAASAADTLLFSVHSLFYRRRSAGKLARDLAQRCAGGFFLAQGGKGLPEPQERIRGLRIRIE